MQTTTMIVYVKYATAREPIARDMLSRKTATCSSQHKVLTTESEVCYHPPLLPVSDCCDDNCHLRVAISCTHNLYAEAVMKLSLVPIGVSLREPQ